MLAGSECVSARGLGHDRRGGHVIPFSETNGLKGSRGCRWGSLFDQHSHLAALTAFAKWEEWIALAVGVWVTLSPWLMQFSNSAAATPVHVIAGTVVALIAAIRIWYTHSGHPQVTA
ncbi:SPW repeat protein [Bradyrhizobium sp.]|uniref:SPW repeat protein n=1 Tax=Bradyrhizobium sp. TaxID=376 RepID=UPI000A04892A|nr:SPW repeat protein [Bradyrhizobium sp.]